MKSYLQIKFFCALNLSHRSCLRPKKSGHTDTLTICGKSGVLFLWMVELLRPPLLGGWVSVWWLGKGAKGLLGYVEEPHFLFMHGSSGAEQGARHLDQYCSEALNKIHLVRLGHFSFPNVWQQNQNPMVKTHIPTLTGSSAFSSSSSAKADRFLFTTGWLSWEGDTSGMRKKQILNCDYRNKTHLLLRAHTCIKQYRETEVCIFSPAASPGHSCSFPSQSVWSPAGLVCLHQAAASCRWPWSSCSSQPLWIPLDTSKSEHWSCLFSVISFCHIFALKLCLLLLYH